MNEDVCTVERFHYLCHELAKDYCDRGGEIPEGLTLHDVGQRFKTLILNELPGQYVEFGTTRYPLVSDGTFDFVKPVPFSEVVKAAKAAGMVPKGKSHDEDEALLDKSEKGL